MFERLSRLNLNDRIVVLPDFFMDRIVKFDSKNKLIELIDYKTRFGGGSVRGIGTVDIKGGNAVNVAYCLAKFGLSVNLFTIANEIGSAVLQRIFSKFGKKVELHISSGKHGITTSLEFEDKESTANIMISDVGDIENYGADRISTVEDLEKISSAKCVVLTNWASNLKGTELANHVFENSKNAFHFIDPADIDVRRDEFRDALRIIGKNTDILSLNENECNSLTSALGLGSMLLKDPTNIELIKSVAKMISNEFGIGVDLHTRTGSAWSDGKETVFEPAFSVEVHTLTGSGDCWDAADVIGYLVNLPPHERLLLSNACSALYIQSKAFESPSMDDLLQFSNNNICRPR